MKHVQLQRYPDALTGMSEYRYRRWVARKRGEHYHITDRQTGQALPEPFPMTSLQDVRAVLGMTNDEGTQQK